MRYCPTNKTSATNNIRRYEIFSKYKKLDATKLDKFDKYLKMYIINFKTIRYELTASDNTIHTILNYEKNKKTGKNS